MTKDAQSFESPTIEGSGGPQVGVEEEMPSAQCLVSGHLGDLSGQQPR